ncbi:SRPBCC domain-containing protein [Phaeobacter sp. 22II1-1F12B]|uniref:SRPBCC family protein n=1 Tax=Phaeobacter sp. 22II1-1F12B TaxID=1317111 RepID=UPI000B524821|nr:SRPBCC domain-containing protein [Phaeobacter sp. 22II1-1F12B]
MRDIQELELVRDYTVSVDRVWRAVTDPSQLMQWFGPEGLRMDDCQMDFTRTGPWTCTMYGRESGDRYKLSGQVTHVLPPDPGGKGSVGFTWGWHDAEDQRGTESHVMFMVSATETGSQLRVVHRDLPDMETARSHSRGWLATLPKLDRLLEQDPEI